ncbi:hypothetical protein [Moorena sp. SIO2C4]|uniref:hypothetical protein n=1 Tax=Moorena sp. SIO2C4 TaxID=2607824 RepID=UPI0013C818BB|nr:hypothetical protein [Moorena sp. SIO2C4]NES39898.1 hypothetical protein [Moorena sp. SIO2C4]
MKRARCQCLDAVAHGEGLCAELVSAPCKPRGNPQDRAASLPRQDAYSTGVTQGREQSLTALEARTYS